MKEANEWIMEMERIFS